MKFAIERDALASLMKTVGDCAANGRSPIAILSNVRLIAHEGRLRATTNNLDQQADATVDAEVEAEGSTTVSAALLRQFATRLPKGALIKAEIDGQDNALVMTAGRNKARIGTIPASDFPCIDTPEPVATFTLTGAQMRGLLARTVPAASTEETRFYLCGVFLHSRDGHLTAVATNGHILICAPSTVKLDALNVILPTTGVNAALRLFGDAESVAVTVTRAGVIFESGGVALTTRIIDGTFPDYVRVVPQRCDDIVSISAESCLSALSIVEAFHDPSQAGNRVECLRDEGDLLAGGLSLTASGTAGTKGKAVADAEFSGNPSGFAVSAKYLRTVIGAFESDRIDLSVDGPDSPILLTSKTEDVISVIMPIRGGAAA